MTPSPLPAPCPATARAFECAVVGLDVYPEDTVGVTVELPAETPVTLGASVRIIFDPAPAPLPAAPPAFLGMPVRVDPSMPDGSTFRLEAAARPPGTLPQEIAEATDAYADAIGHQVPGAARAAFRIALDSTILRFLHPQPDLSARLQAFRERCTDVVIYSLGPAWFMEWTIAGAERTTAGPSLLAVFEQAEKHEAPQPPQQEKE